MENDRAAVLAEIMSGADASQEKPGASGAASGGDAAAPESASADSDPGTDQTQEVSDEASGAQESSEEVQGEGEASPPPDEAAKGDEDGSEDESAPQDPKVAKALAAIHRQEKRAKESHKARMQELRETEQTLAMQFEALKRFEAFRASGKRDPVAALEALGYEANDFQLAGKRLLIKAKQAGALTDPKLKEQLEGAGRAVEAESELVEMRREHEALKQYVYEREETERRERVIGQYLDETVKAVSDATPLVASMLKKNPGKVRTELRKIANELAEETGERPDYEDVVNTLETRRKEELAELGLEYPTPTSNTPPKQKQTSAGEKKTAKTLRSDMAPSAAPKGSFESREEEIADVRRRIEAEQLDS